MRGLLRLVLTLCLFAGLATGAVSHAAEIGGHDEVVAVDGGPHADGDHDRAPAGADKDIPHHHSLCHGHDLTSAMRACAPVTFTRMALPRPAASSAPPGAAPAFPLRPPIA
jgi:hypothetical protein